jgi:Rv2525c-like, glycoside hydrolase-like domain
VRLGLPLDLRLAIGAFVLPSVLFGSVFVGVCARAVYEQSSESENAQIAFLGFDRNDYPGDENLALLRQSFAFTGYWLNVPPGGKVNSWAGKRDVIRDAGFGFLALFNGRLDAEVKRSKDSVGAGRADAMSAVAAAKKEGFPARTIIFLDIEEGGRMLPEQKAYIYAWVDGVNASGYRAGIYCSGIAAMEGGGVEVVTAKDLQQNAAGRNIVFWVANDACPPSPGCVFPKHPPKPSDSGIGFADVWQTTQSPRRRDIAGGCRATYDRDDNCYAPKTRERGLFLDIDVAKTKDPSSGR